MSDAATETTNVEPPDATPGEPQQWFDVRVTEATTKNGLTPQKAVVLTNYKPLSRDIEEFRQAGYDHVNNALNTAVSEFFATGKGARLRQLEDRHKQAVAAAEPIRLEAIRRENEWKVCAVEGTDTAQTLPAHLAADQDWRRAEAGVKALREAVEAERAVAREHLAAELQRVADQTDADHRALYQMAEALRDQLRIALTLPLIQYERAAARGVGMNKARADMHGKLSKFLEAAFNPKPKAAPLPVPEKFTPATIGGDFNPTVEKLEPGLPYPPTGLDHARQMHYGS